VHAGVLVELVLLCAKEASALVGDGDCCWVMDAVVLVELVLLLGEESSALVGDFDCCCCMQWCSSSWCFSS
jgi:hypothetical protein